MKCPHCGADMKFMGFDANGFLASPLHDWAPVAVAFQVVCPACKVSGPRQSTKKDAIEALGAICGQEAQVDS